MYDDFGKNGFAKGRMGVVDTIHSELGYDAHVDSLKKIQGIWKTLQSLRAKAEKDAKYGKQYRAYLERCIVQLRDADPELGDSEIEAACTQFNDWRHQRYVALKIKDHEARRQPQPWEAWCEKWLPQEWDELHMAFGNVCERTTQRRYDKLRDAYERLFQAYLGATNGTNR